MICLKLEDTGCYKCKERENPLIEIKLDDKDYVSLLCPILLNRDINR